MLLPARLATPLGIPEAAGTRAEKKPRLVCWWGDARHAGKRVPIIGVLSSVPWSGLAQETQELAKQAQNPIADLISVPLQHNFNFGVGPEEDPQYVLDIQLVIPVNLIKGWTLMAGPTAREQRLLGRRQLGSSRREPGAH